MINVKQVKIACVGYIAVSVIMYIAGIMCLITPLSHILALSSVKIIAGILLACYGIIKIIGYFSNDLYCLAFQYDFACGVLLIVLGITLLCIGDRFEGTFIYTGLAVLILLDSLLGIQTSIDSKRFGLSSWATILALSVLTGTLGAVLLVKVTVWAAGLALLSEGVLRHYIVLNTAFQPDRKFKNRTRILRSKMEGE